MRTRAILLSALVLLGCLAPLGVCHGNPVIAAACCLYGGECIVLEEETCAQMGGFWRYPIWECEPNPCWGACCTEFGTCVVTDYVSCVAPMGEFLGVGTTCANDPCGLGACCLADGTCVVLHDEECTAQGGEYTYPRYPCSLNPCETEAVTPTMPTDRLVGAAAPNPFRHETAVTWTGLAQAGGEPSAAVLDAAGRLVRILSPSARDTDHLVCRWDGTDETGQEAPAGVYFVRVISGARAGAVVVLRLR